MMCIVLLLATFYAYERKAKVEVTDREWKDQNCGFLNYREIFFKFGSDRFAG